MAPTKDDPFWDDAHIRPESAADVAPCRARSALNISSVLNAENDSRFQLVSGRSKADRRTVMAREVRAALHRSPRSIPPKYFYDDVGSRLFDTICDLPEYYVTRAERELLLSNAERIVEMTRATSLIEIGSGMARKTGALLRAMCDRHASPLYVPFDIAPEPICESATLLLRAYPTLRVRGIVGDFNHDCARLSLGVQASNGPRLFAFLGSTIGNLDEREAPALVREIGALMREQDRFLLGVDRVKEPHVLNRAYNDDQGVTAAFNRNVLRVVARELDGEIDDAAFQHLAFYSAGRERIEMHLVATRATSLTLRAADVHIGLRPEERILTEISRKFTRVSVERLLQEGGMRMVDWMDGDGPSAGAFALCVARRIGRD